MMRALAGDEAAQAAFRQAANFIFPSTTWRYWDVATSTVSAAVVHFTAAFETGLGDHGAGILRSHLNVRRLECPICEWLHGNSTATDLPRQW
jgi:hypothetical protein